MPSPANFLVLGSAWAPRDDGEFHYCARKLGHAARLRAGMTVSSVKNGNWPFYNSIEPPRLPIPRTMEERCAKAQTCPAAAPGNDDDLDQDCQTIKHGCCGLLWRTGCVMRKQYDNMELCGIDPFTQHIMMGVTAKVEKTVTRKTKEPPVKFRAVVVVPVLQPLRFWYDSQYFRPSLNQALDELTTFSAQELKLTKYNAEDLRVIVRDTPNGIEGQNRANGDSWVQRLPCIELEWSVNLTLTEYHVTSSDGKPVPMVDRISYCVQFACEEFASTVVSILVASHIAQPGILRTYEVEIWVGEKFLKTTGRVCGHFPEVVEFAGEKSWPVIESLSIRQVWNWMCLFEPLSENLGQSEIGRALNALSYVLAEKQIYGSSLTDLMWAMIGLEALYGRGTSDLTYQLVEKAGVLLGQSAGFEKLVKEMYRSRSIFIHGKAPFPSAFFTYDCTPEYLRHSHDALFLAMAVLIASLQQLAKRNWTSLNLLFVADGSNDSSCRCQPKPPPLTAG